ncbi:unnamed protein product [Trichobilharzia regenti]|nr:unnamed protein product [Trichobilharzia regenti]
MKIYSCDFKLVEVTFWVRSLVEWSPKPRLVKPEAQPGKKNFSTSENSKANIISEKSKYKTNKPKLSIPSTSAVTTATAGGTTTSSSNPFADWQWSFAPSLIAHEGWVGICVLPLDQSSSINN